MTDPPEMITIPRQLLDDLLDEDDCSFDHHGGCQAHGYLSLEPGELCPQEEAKRILAASPSPTAAPAEPEFVIVEGYDEIEALPFTGDIEAL